MISRNVADREERSRVRLLACGMRCAREGHALLKQAAHQPLLMHCKQYNSMRASLIHHLPRIWLASYCELLPASVQLRLIERKIAPSGSQSLQAIWQTTQDGWIVYSYTCDCCFPILFVVAIQSARVESPWTPSREARHCHCQDAGPYCSPPFVASEWT